MSEPKKKPKKEKGKERGLKKKGSKIISALKKKLKMTFDPNTIEHLGVRMYSTLPPVFAELVGNAHDADAENVVLTLNDSGDEKEIIVEDDGVGMTFEEINDKFLRIGRNRRVEEKSETTLKGRKIIGKKGLGKLSFFGVAGEAEISTKKDGKESVFKMVWEDIKKEKGEYAPTIIKENEACPLDKCGTKIILRKIKRKSKFLPEDIASNLSKVFIIESDFKIEVRHNSNEPIIVSNERRFADLEKEVEWKIPDSFQHKNDYGAKKQITGYLMTTKKPIPPNTDMRGIILFSRKKMVNLPEYFSDSTSSHFFSYLTGWLEVDFIDDLEDDVIATNRQSLNWGHEEMQKLKNYLRELVNWLERDWRQKREKVREKELSEKTGIKISDWLDKLPKDIRGTVKLAVEVIVKKSELSPAEHKKVIGQIHRIVPEYPKYHWRHLHPEVRAASEEGYKNEDYYRAFHEAVKRYTDAVRKVSKSDNSKDASLMGEVFGKDEGGKKVKPSALKVAQGFKRRDGSDFRKSTIDNIEEGQKFLSQGVVSGCRNPVSHEEIEDLRESKLFTENDCLDALSLLSHLFSRLDNAMKG